MEGEGVLCIGFVECFAFSDDFFTSGAVKALRLLNRES